MSFGKSKAPPPPDYAAAATAQGAANEEAARVAGKINNPNIYNAYGQRIITFDGDQPTINETLSPEQQALFDQQNRISKSFGDVAEGGLDRVEKSIGSDYDPSNLPGISSGTLERDQVTQSLLDRLQPSLDRQRNQQQEALIMQGHNRGGNAWEASQDDIARQENDARLAAVMAGGQEQSRLYGLESANRARQMQEDLALRNLPLSEINALRTGSQPTVPQFQSYQGQAVGAAPVFDAVTQGYNSQLGAYNAEQAGKSGFTSGLFSLGAGALAGGYF